MIVSIFEAAAQQDSNYHDNDYDESADYPLAIHSYGPKLEGGKQPKGKIVKTKSKQSPKRSRGKVKEKASSKQKRTN